MKLQKGHRGEKYKILEKLTQVLRIETNPNSVEAIRFRSALTRVCCVEIFNCKANLQEILGNINSEMMNEFIGEESLPYSVYRIRYTGSRQCDINTDFR